MEMSDERREPHHERDDLHDPEGRACVSDPPTRVHSQGYGHEA